MSSTNAAFKLISGIFNSIALIALACRLQSKNINPKKRFIWTLFFYAALQPLTLITSLGEIHFDTHEPHIFHQKTALPSPVEINFSKNIVDSAVDSLVFLDSNKVVQIGVTANSVISLENIKANNVKSFTFDIQVTDNFFIPYKNVRLLALTRLIALALGKCMFFLFCLWLFESKRLINYFLIIPEVDKEDDLFEEKYKKHL